MLELLAAAAVGVVIGGAGRWLLIRAALRRTDSPSSRQLATLALALLTIVVWLVFGLIVVGEHVIGLDDPMIIVYALLSLTVVRMLPVALALAGIGFDRATVLFLGWFGPRGLASVVFVLLGLEGLEAAGVPWDPLGSVVAWTVIISVIVHGFSAAPSAAKLGAFAADLPDDARSSSATRSHDRLAGGSTTAASRASDVLTRVAAAAMLAP